MTMMPIIIHSQEPDLCPECNKLEDKREVCGHCGYMYPEESINFWEGLAIACFIVGIVFVVIWVIATFAGWSISDTTLVETLQGQWKWVKELFGRIW